MTQTRRLTILFTVLAWVGLAPGFVAAQTPSETLRVTMSWQDTPLDEVVGVFSELTGRSIIIRTGVEARVTAEIRDQPWEAALHLVLASHGLVAITDDSGVMRIDRVGAQNESARQAPLITRAYRVTGSPVKALTPAVGSVLSDRGRATFAISTNTLVVTDVWWVHDAILELLPG